MKSERLLAPCPFCGFKPTVKAVSHNSASYCYQVFCAYCKAAGPTRYDKDESIERWEQRHEIQD